MMKVCSFIYDLVYFLNDPLSSFIRSLMINAKTVQLKIMIQSLLHYEITVN